MNRANLPLIVSCFLAGVFAASLFAVVFVVMPLQLKEERDNLHRYSFQVYDKEETSVARFDSVTGEITLHVADEKSNQVYVLNLTKPAVLTDAVWHAPKSDGLALTK